MLTGATALAVDEIDDAIGQAGLMHDTGQGKGQQRRILRALPHTGIAAHYGWNHLPERYRGREIAGIDDAANPQWSAIGEQFLVGQFAVDGLTIQASPLALEE